MTYLLDVQEPYLEGSTDVVKRIKRKNIFPPPRSTRFQGTMGASLGCSVTMESHLFLDQGEHGDAASEF